jgi:acylphosphatase
MINGRRYVVSGRVQGVGFRLFVRDAAAREGIHGWVRNLPEGAVEIEAHGDHEALIRFERAGRCADRRRARGPGAAFGAPSGVPHRTVVAGID